MLKEIYNMTQGATKVSGTPSRKIQPNLLLVGAIKNKDKMKEKPDK
jgi:hypothetical protein